MPQDTDIVDLTGIGNLAGILEARVARTPDAEAYRQPDAEGKTWSSWTWTEFAAEVSRWQAALRAEGLQPGDRVAIMLGNRREWAVFDMAALGLGLTTVPLYVNDRAENTGLVLEDCGAVFLLIGDQTQWDNLSTVERKPEALRKIVSLEPVSASPSGLQPVTVSEWLPAAGETFQVEPVGDDALATICYTSGTTGRPKGVMLSHRNILFNVGAVLDHVAGATARTFSCRFCRCRTCSSAPAATTCRWLPGRRSPTPARPAPSPRISTPSSRRSSSPCPGSSSESTRESRPSSTSIPPQ